MDRKQQTIKIAQSLGWTNIHENIFVGYVCGYEPEIDYNRLTILPDYLSDLNAMHEAEDRLSEKERLIYEIELSVAVHGIRSLPDKGRCFLYARATAEQRAEAFLRTRGLWED